MEAGSRPTTVLIIEDSPFIAHLLELTLRQSRQGPFQTQHADCLAVGLQMLAARSVDVVLLDLSLPDSDGLASLEALIAAVPALPIVVLTATDDDGLAIQAVQNGAQDYLVKGEVDAIWLGRAMRYAIERKRLAEELREASERLRFLAETDSLTGVANRYKSTDSLEKLIALSLRRGDPFSFVVIDLDFFKLVNDRHGHAAGDAVLRRLGDTLLKSFRTSDVVARWGGEEFILGLYASSKQDTVRRVSALLDQWRAECFQGSRGSSFYVTFSAGVASCAEDAVDLPGLYEAADAALYGAKARGRNQILPYDVKMRRASYHSLK
jgi:diguanylate cyclase (GGDEF)-like protein